MANNNKTIDKIAVALFGARIRLKLPKFRMFRKKTRKAEPDWYYQTHYSYNYRVPLMIDQDIAPPTQNITPEKQNITLTKENIALKKHYSTPTKQSKTPTKHKYLTPEQVSGIHAWLTQQPEEFPDDVQDVDDAVKPPRHVRSTSVGGGRLTNWDYVANKRHVGDGGNEQKFPRFPSARGPRPSVRTLF